MQSGMFDRCQPCRRQDHAEAAKELIRLGQIDRSLLSSELDAPIDALLLGCDQPFFSVLDLAGELLLFYMELDPIADATRREIQLDSMETESIASKKKLLMASGRPNAILPAFLARDPARIIISSAACPMVGTKASVSDELDCAEPARCDRPHLSMKIGAAGTLNPARVLSHRRRQLSRLGLGKSLGRVPRVD